MNTLGLAKRDFEKILSEIWDDISVFTGGSQTETATGFKVFWCHFDDDEKAEKCAQNESL